ncbi:hypothetical protein L3Y34_012860 [Caenorhabditis briggsae]|uniref:NTF2-like domain-containing protein n=1 Tax=Caenorhabditis briggsae TaxID=6238 RepID=A0AAE8ZSG0_CAEBR|nr:hypothetical protein L3Y34_012860 [Caenorhabditis briggsae]
MDPDNKGFLMKYIRQLEVMKFLAARIRNMHFQVGVIDRKVVFLQGFENLVAHILTIFENPRTPEAENDCDSRLIWSLESNITDRLSAILKKGFTYKGCQETFNKEDIIDIAEEIEHEFNLYWNITTIQINNTTTDSIVEVTEGDSNEDSDEGQSCL